MLSAPVTIVAPASLPISAELATAQLRGIASDEGPYLDLLIGSACAHVEAYTGLRLVTQTIEVHASSFADLAHFDVGPVQSVSAIHYLDQAGVLQTLDPDRYELFGAGLDRGVRPAFAASWPTTRPVADAVLVTMVAGFGENAVPLPIIQAALLLVGDWYQNREDTIAERSVSPEALPNGVATLLANWRLY